jgi:hypothetical protein
MAEESRSWTHRNVAKDTEKGYVFQSFLKFVVAEEFD